ncbi:MAG: RNA polymerase sigma factor [Planctomycetaceae bacterium]
MTDLPQTRQSLLLQLGKRSDEAWSEFLNVYENALYRYCRARGLQDADACDATQDVLAAVHKRLPTWDRDTSKGSFRAWLFRVARNISVDEINRRARRATASGDSQVAEFLSQLPDGSEDQHGDFDEEYRKSLFDWASKQVKREVRDVTWKSFRMTAIDGQKAEQVATTLGVPIGSVYTAKCRVVARIRSKIDELSGEFDDM